MFKTIMILILCLNVPSINIDDLGSHGHHNPISGIVGQAPNKKTADAVTQHVLEKLAKDNMDADTAEELLFDFDRWRDLKIAKQRLPKKFNDRVEPIILFLLSYKVLDKDKNIHLVYNWENRDVSDGFKLALKIVAFPKVYHTEYQKYLELVKQNEKKNK